MGPSFVSGWTREGITRTGRRCRLPLSHTLILESGRLRQGPGGHPGGTAAAAWIEPLLLPHIVSGAAPGPEGCLCYDAVPCHPSGSTKIVSASRHAHTRDRAVVENIHFAGTVTKSCAKSAGRSSAWPASWTGADTSRN